MIAVSFCPSRWFLGQKECTEVNPLDWERKVYWFGLGLIAFRYKTEEWVP